MVRASLNELSQSKRRSRLEIYLDVLKIIGCGIDKPTRVMYMANLSWAPFSEILVDLERRGLIERKIVKNRVRLFVTEKGKRLLKTLETVSAELVGQVRPEMRALI